MSSEMTKLQQSLYQKVAVVADSSVALPKELTEAYKIGIIPLQLTHEGKSYRDGIDISPTEFYDLLRKAEKPPTTSAPPPSDCLKAYKEASKIANNILCITLASKLSGTYNSALQAREIVRKELPETKIEVLDSLTAASASGLVTLAAAKKASQGLDFDNVLEAANQVMSKVHLYALLDTLKYLVKGGRVPKAVLWATSILSIKPILYLKPLSGEVNPFERPRTKKRGINRLVEIVKNYTGDSKVHVAVMHADALEEAKLLRELLSELNCEELFISYITPVIGAHAGPGALGIAFYTED